jgi:class 3 adenylate cyclase/Tfp pilus assembly protein PilF
MIGLLIPLTFLWGSIPTQEGGNAELDSLKRGMQAAPSDSARAVWGNAVGKSLFPNRPDEALSYWEKALTLVDAGTGPSAADRLRGELLNNIAAAEERLGNRSKALHRYREAITVRSRSGDRQGLGQSLMNLAVFQRKQGDTDGALQGNLQALDIAREVGDVQLEASCLMNLALLYQYLELEQEASKYYQQAEPLAARLNDPGLMSRLLNGRGGLYQRTGRYDEALRCFLEALRIRRSVNDRSGMATTYSNIADIQSRRGAANDAAAYLDSCIQLREGLGDRSGLVSAYARRAGIALASRDHGEALRWAGKAAAMASATGTLNDRITATRTLSEALAANGEHQRALAAWRDHMAARDSFDRTERAEDLLREDFRISFERLRVADSVQLEQERSMAQVRIEEAEARSLWQWVALSLSAALLLALLVLLRATSRNERRSEALLLNILPAAVAQELKRTGRSRAVRFNDATVLFADIVGFTALSERMTPEDLVHLVDDCFGQFDLVMDECGMEKIKTIGDAYMAVAGLPGQRTDHALLASRAALRMLEVTAGMRDRGIELHIRVGIHSGPVVAGIVGRRKFQYDVWGDTVNTASRLQECSEPDRINVSLATRERLGLQAVFVDRGELAVKGKAPMRMFYLQRLTDGAASTNGGYEQAVG